MVKFKDPTHSVVFWIFHLTNFLLLGTMFAVYWYLKEENTFELVMGEIFVFAALATFLGSKFGGYLGAVMEEDTCGEMDMGVLSTMGGFLGATVFALVGAAAVGLYFFVPANVLHIPVTMAVIGFFVFSFRNEIKVQRLHNLTCCGKRADKEGKALPKQPMAMKNKLGVMLFLTVFVEVILTLVMIIVMKRDLANQWMLGGMMYGMSGAMIGGFLGGWIAGLLDRHEGHAECDNPIMVCGMSLMGGMMGGMLAGMIGGMNALMGVGTIAPTMTLPLLLLVVFYFWMYKNQFKVVISPRKQPEKTSTSIEGEMVWQKN